MQFMTLDKELAASVGSSSRLTANAHHIVKITQAYASVTPNGAKYVALNLVNQAGDSADEIKLYYENSEGERLSGKAQLNAIMALNGINVLTQAQGQYKTYDFEAGGITQKQGLVIPELVGAYVGVVLSENWYTNQHGEPKYTLQVSGIFHHQSQKTARQHLYNEPAQNGQIDKAISYATRQSEEGKAKVAAPPSKPAPQKIGGGFKELDAMGKAPSRPPVNEQISDEEMPF